MTDEANVRIGQLTSNVQAMDSMGMQDPAMLHCLARALMPLLCEMFDHDKRMQRELSMHDNPLDRIERGSS